MKIAVLVTRPEPMATQTAARVAALGLTPVIAPLLDISLLPANLPEAGRLQAVLVTSAAAVPGVPASHRGLPLLAVGDMTAERAREAGFSRVQSAGADAQALADLAVRQLNPAGAPLLLAAREGLGEPLELDLQDRGFTVIRRAVYAVAPVASLPEPARAALRDGSLRAALFFSADTARAFVRLVQAENLGDLVAKIEALAIGEPAGVALRSLPWRGVRVASHPTQDNLLGLLQ